MCANEEPENQRTRIVLARSRDDAPVRSRDAGWSIAGVRAARAQRHGAVERLPANHLQHIARES